MLWQPLLKAPTEALVLHCGLSPKDQSRKFGFPEPDYIYYDLFYPHLKQEFLSNYPAIHCPSSPLPNTVHEEYFLHIHCRAV